VTRIQLQSIRTLADAENSHAAAVQAAAAIPLLIALLATTTLSLPAIKTASDLKLPKRQMRTRISGGMAGE
jgi:hypothetical protein